MSIAVAAVAHAQSAACNKHCSTLDFACKDREGNCETKIGLYKAYMAQLSAGQTLAPLPELYVGLLAPFYPGIDLHEVRIGYTNRQKSIAITDCTTIYFFDLPYMRKVRDATLDIATDNLTLLYHELAHTEQCRNQGGREPYAVMWWQDLDMALAAGPDPVAIHDAQPMEAAADARATSVDSSLPDGLVAPVSMTSFAPDVSSPRPVNNTITWTAKATGGRGAVEFAFDVTPEGVAPGTPSFASSNTFTWTPSEEGRYTVTVRVRQASPARAEVTQTAQFDIDGAGGVSGAEFTSRCRPGAVMIGLDVNSGVYVDSVAARCALVGSNAMWLRRRFVFRQGSLFYESTGARAGGPGGSPASLRCAADSGVTVLMGASGTAIDRLGIECRPLSSAGGGGTIGTTTTASPSAQAPVGGLGGSSFRLECPAGQVAVGIRGRAQPYLQQVDLVCENPTP
ncbi:MAG TPA: hypothetical protein VKB93_12520 [Thermoanaerobaculia bacterium]|nr:hypothetical protein [Thermoanaerobaculia bacterium]